jgi:hypothetical protein
MAMHAIHELMAAPEILDRSTSDFPEASGPSPVAVGSPVAEGLADAAGVDSKATLERRVES